MWWNSCVVRGTASKPCLTLSSPEGEGLGLHAHSLIWSNSCALRGPASTPCLTLSSPEGEGLDLHVHSLIIRVRTRVPDPHHGSRSSFSLKCGFGSGISFSLQCGSGSGSCSSSRWCETTTTCPTDLPGLHWAPTPPLKRPQPSTAKYWASTALEFLP